MPTPPPVTIATLSFKRMVDLRYSGSDGFAENGALEYWSNGALGTLRSSLQYSNIPLLQVFRSPDCRIDQRFGRERARHFAADGADAVFDVLQRKNMADHLLHRKFGLFDDAERRFGRVVIRGKAALELDLAPNQFIHQHRRHGGVAGQAAEDHGRLAVQAVD